LARDMNEDSCWMMAMATGTGVFQRFSALTAALYQLRRSSNMLQILLVFCGGAEAQETRTRTAARRRILFILFRRDFPLSNKHILDANYVKNRAKPCLFQDNGPNTLNLIGRGTLHAFRWVCHAA